MHAIILISGTRKILLSTSPSGSTFPGRQSKEIYSFCGEEIDRVIIGKMGLAGAACGDGS